jgi:invasion protein IalB
MNKNMKRLAIGGGALVLGLLLGWAVRGVATYNVNSSFNTTYDDWRAFCPPAATEAASCEAMGDVVDPNLKATVARISIVRDKKAENKEMIAFMLPHDVLLDAGVGVQVGKEAVKVFQYRTCNDVGCIAIVPLEPEMKSALRSNTETKISFTGAQPNSKAQTLTVSFKGFNSALSAYERGESRRTSAFWRIL